MKICLLLLFFFICSLSLSAQQAVIKNIVGVTAGYDNKMIRAGVSLLKTGSPSYFFNTRHSITYNDNLTENEKAFGSQVTLGKIFCFGMDMAVFFDRKGEGSLLLFKPKVGIGIIKYGEISFGYNMFTDGDRNWSFAIFLNLPLLEFGNKK